MAIIRKIIYIHFFQWISEAIDDREDVPEVQCCSLCLDFFSTPKVTPCGHTFCLACLKSYASTWHQTNRLLCPLCRNEFEVPQGEIDSLPNNYLAMSLLQNQHQSKESFEKCDMCSRPKIICSFCETCKAWMCTTCTEVHNRIQDTAAHTLKSREELQQYSTKAASEKTSNLHMWRSKVSATLAVFEEENYDEMRSAINLQAEKFHQLIEDKRETLLNKVAEFHRQERLESKECIDYGSRMISEIKQFEALIEGMVQNG